MNIPRKQWLILLLMIASVIFTFVFQSFENNLFQGTSKPHFKKSEVSKTTTTDYIRDQTTATNLKNKPNPAVAKAKDAAIGSKNNDTWSPDEFKSLGSGVNIVSIEEQPIPEVYKEQTRKLKQDMDDHGYGDASENEVTEIERYLSPENKNQLKPLSNVIDKITFKPADLDTIPSFKEGKLLGSIEHGAYVDGKWTGLTRLYEIPDLGTIKVSENNYVAANGGIQLAKELINMDVNGFPAEYTVQESASGKALTNILWVTPNTEYNLSINQNAAKIEGMRDSLFDLANSIPIEKN